MLFKKRGGCHFSNMLWDDVPCFRCCYSKTSFNHKIEFYSIVAVIFRSIWNHEFITEFSSYSKMLTPGTKKKVNFKAMLNLYTFLVGFFWEQELCFYFIVEKLQLFVIFLILWQWNSVTFVCANIDCLLQAYMYVSDVLSIFVGQLLILEGAWSLVGLRYVCFTDVLWNQFKN